MTLAFTHVCKNEIRLWVLSVPLEGESFDVILTDHR